MKSVQITKVVSGSVLAEPVYTKNNVLLCKAGIPLSMSLISMLQNFGITEVKVEAIFNEKIDTKNLNIYLLDNLTYMAIKRLDIDSLIICSKQLVNSIMETNYPALLDVYTSTDDLTRKHSINVANYAVFYGIKNGYSIHELQILALGSLLHDIGKSCESVKDLINKRDRLTETEYELVKMHPQLGYNLVKDLPYIETAVKEIILQHHENWDGSGYPRKLVKENSYKLARVVHICDVYDALSMGRPYKCSLPKEFVKHLLNENSGTMFDPVILRKFLDCMPTYFVGESIINRYGCEGIVIDISEDNAKIFYKDKMYDIEYFRTKVSDDMQVGGMR